LFLQDNASSDIIDYYATFEFHVLPNVANANVEELFLKYGLDTTTQYWITLTEKHWFCLYNRQEGHFFLFADDPHFFREAYTEVLAFLFRQISSVSGCVFHGAAIQIEGCCYLFLGPSGTGKTTLSRQAQKKGFPVLSDETVFVSRNRNLFTAYSSPFGRICHGPREAPLAGIFFLKQGAATSFSRIINASQALARAWQDSCYRDKVVDDFGQKMRFKNRMVTPAERLKVFNLWHEIFSTIPCFEMEFPIDFDDWDKLPALLAHE